MVNFILDKKYIVINKNNFKQIIIFLYKNGYTWGYSSWAMDYTIKEFDKLTKERDPIYLKFEGNMFFFNLTEPFHSECFNINKLLREDKLKRIFK